MNDGGVPSAAMRRLLTLMDHRADVFDPNTAERLLSGQLPIDDSPPAAKPIATMIDSVTAEPTDYELATQSVSVAVLTAAIRHASVDALGPRRTPMTKPRITQLAAASTVGVMTLFASLAGANALPGSAQSVASSVLGTVGISVPGPNDHAGDHPAGRGESTSHPSNDSTTSSSSGKGSDISDTAHNTPTTGVEKGATISDQASGGASQAGDHGSAGTGAPDESTSGTPPVTTPPFATPPFATPPVTGPPVSTPPVSIPPVPTGSGAASGGLSRKP
jgi:hypothetical protein